MFHQFGFARTSHLGEVVGYLGGSWDLGSHNLSILQAFPCRVRLGNKGTQVEEEIRQQLEQRHLSLVGWYHSHPRSAAQPSVKDLESQMEYQIAMKGDSDSSYTPCVGLICSPYDAFNSGLQSVLNAFWVMPPPEYRPYEYGKPMQMIYSVTRDSFLTQDLLLEMVCKEEKERAREKARVVILRSPRFSRCEFRLSRGRRHIFPFSVL